MSNAAGLRKDMRAMVRRALRQGFVELPVRGSGHPALLAPNGSVIVYPSSPSDYRSVRALRVHLRRNGFADNR